MLDFSKHISEFILKSGFIGCLVIDRDANMLYTNEVFDHLMRGIEGKVQGLNLIEVLREEEKESVRNLVKTLFEHGTIPKTDWEIINRLEEKLYLDFEGSLIEENGEQYGIGLVIDKTSEHSLKKNLEYTNKQRELAIKTGKLGIWKLNLATNTNIWNDELLDIYELTREEWEEDLEGWQKLVFEEDMELANRELGKAFDGEHVFDVRFRIKTKSGKVKHIYASAAPFFDENGDVTEVHGVNIDISQLVETEQAAFEQAHYFKKITEKLPGLVVQYYINPDGTDGINYLSTGVEELYGLDHDETSKNVDLIWKQVVEEDVPYVAESLQESALNLTDWECTFRIHDIKGDLKYIRTIGSPEKDENGKITWDTIALDITKQVLQEKEIWDKNSQLQNFTDQLPGVALRYYLNPDGTDGLLFLSKGVEDIYEVNRDDALEDNSIMWDHIHPDDIELMKSSVAESAANLTRWEFQHRIVTASGKTKHLNSIGTPQQMEDGTIVWDTISMEITAQIENENAIRESQRMLDSLTNQIPGLVYIYQLKPDGTDAFLYLSKGIEDIFELQQIDALNDTSSIWACIHPDDLEELTLSIQKSAKELSQWNNVYRIITPSGKLKYVQGSGTPIKLTDGTIQWYSVGVDFTKEKQQELKILEKQKHLNVISDHFPGVVYTYIRKPDGTELLTYLSKGVESIHGIDIEAAYQDPNVMWNLVHPDDIPSFAVSIEESSTTMNEWENIFRVKVIDGSYHWFQGYGMPTQLDDGSILWTSITFDINDQMIARDEARFQKKQLESITDRIQGVVLKYQVHPDGTDSIPYISSRVEEYWGVDAETVTTDMKKAWARVVPEDVEPTRKSIEKSIASMSEWSQIMRFVSPTGAIKHMHGYGLPKLLDNGIVEYDTVMIDVTAQELALQEAREKERQLEILGDQIPGVVFVYFRNPDGTDGFSYFSDGFEELHGFDKSKALENPKILWDQVHPEDLPFFVSSMMESAASLTKLDFQYRIIRPDGEVRYLQGFGSPNKQDDGTIVWNAVNLDITDRKLAEVEANRSSAKLRAFIKSSPIAIYQIDPNGTVTDFWNSAAEQIYGWTRDEVLNNTMPTVANGNRDEFNEIIEDIRISHKPKQFQITRKNRYNEEIILEITAGPLFDENGKLTDLLIIANDITELQEYRKTLETALREKEILLQEIHHRVKNNLAIVSGLLELQALKDDNEHDMSLIIEARNRIHSIAMVHEQLYQDMDFSHINPKEYYQKLLKKLQANTTSVEREINYDLKFDLERININRAVPLGLLINELFTNSIKHAFTDGTGNLKLHFSQVGNQIRVYYEDDGPGFVIDEIKDKNTIGWQLIETLLMQLDSTYTMDTKGRFKLDFTFEETMHGSQSHYA